MGSTEAHEAVAAARDRRGSRVAQRFHMVSSMSRRRPGWLTCNNLHCSHETDLKVSAQTMAGLNPFRLWKCAYFMHVVVLPQPCTRAR